MLKLLQVWKVTGSSATYFYLYIVQNCDVTRTMILQRPDASTQSQTQQDQTHCSIRFCDGVSHQQGDQLHPSLFLSMHTWGFNKGSWIYKKGLHQSKPSSWSVNHAQCLSDVLTFLLQNLSSPLSYRILSLSRQTCVILDKRSASSSYSRPCEPVPVYLALNATN